MEERNCTNCYYHSQCKLLPFNSAACNRWRPYMPPRRYIRHLVAVFTEAAMKAASHVYDDKLRDEFVAAIWHNGEYWEEIIRSLENTGNIVDVSTKDERTEWYAREGWRR